MKKTDRKIPGRPATLVSRRRVLTLASSALVLPTLGTSANAFSLWDRLWDRRRPLAGIQLYTLRTAMKNDVPGTLGQVAKIGYKEVEFAGYFGHSPAEIKKMVSDLGMTAPSSHIQVADVQANPKAVIDAALTAGHQFVVIAWFPPEKRKTLDQWKGWTDVLNGFATQCHGAGLRFCYHNHFFEFLPIDGVLPYDILLENTDKKTVEFELDMYWAASVGVDLGNLLAKNRGRIPLCHVKDMTGSGAMTDIGEGTIDFARLFARPDIAPFEHYFYENDDTTTPLESAAISYKALTAILEKLPARA